MKQLQCRLTTNAIQICSKGFQALVSIALNCQTEAFTSLQTQMLTLNKAQSSISSKPYEKAEIELNSSTL